MNISPADRYNMKDTCSNNSRGKKKPFVSSKGRHFLCVSSPWGLLTRLSWVSDELRRSNGKQFEDPQYLSTMTGAGATAGMVFGPRASVGAGHRRLCAMIRFFWWPSMTSSNTRHVSRSGTIQDRAGDNLLEPRDSSLDMYIEGHNLMRLSVFFY